MISYLYFKYMCAKKIIDKVKVARKIKDESIAIAISTDHTFIDQTKALVRSLVNTGMVVRLYILNVRLTDLELTDITRSCPDNVEVNVIFVNDKRLEDLKISKKWPIEAWSRVLIPEIINEDIVVYLDVDCIVTDELSSLKKIVDQDFFIGGVKSPYYMKKKVNHEYLSNAINSGVMIMNTRKLQQFDFTNKVIRFAKEYHHELIMPDQDAINYVCRHIMQNIDPKYNVMNFFFAYSMNKILKKYGKDLFSKELYEKSRVHPSIIHFNGGPYKRPWQRGFVKHPYSNIYDYYHHH